MHAIISTCGKQYRVAQGDEIYVEKLGLDDGAQVKFTSVLALYDGDKVTWGTPLISGAEVVGKVIKSGKQKKIIVFKFKAKKNYRRRQGHRQPYTKVLIESVQGSK